MFDGVQFCRGLPVGLSVEEIQFCKACITGGGTSS